MEQTELTFETPFDIARDDAQATIDALPVGLKRLALIIRQSRKESPIMGRSLGQFLGCDLRSIAASVQALVLEHRLPIGSTRGEPSGYYWIHSLDELDAVCAMYHNTAMKLLVREAALKRITLDELLGQMRLDLKPRIRSINSGQVNTD